jgi:hypothetical protein
MVGCAFRRSASLFVAHDLVRKPDTTFRDHAMQEAKVGSLLLFAKLGRRMRRENEFLFAPSIVIAGLDPAIHGSAPLERFPFKSTIS